MDERSSLTFLQGDCRKMLRKLEENSIDSIVTDPPYNLKFMGKAWDATGIAFQPEMWKEVLRVLKPGGHLLAMGGTRTHHRLWCAVEDAGFEIRDTLMWLYGQGFPKSLDVSKAIDKAVGAERKVVGIKPGHEEFANRDTDGDTKFKGPLEGFDRPWMHDGDARERYHQQTAPATESAEQWEGWGTALKPAWEPILLARKPFSGTVVVNVLEHSTGALNIGGCRIGTDIITTHSRGGSEAFPKRPGERTVKESGRTVSQRDVKANSRKGRWPANVMLDEEAAASLDAQTGTLKSGVNCIRKREGYWGAGDVKHGGLGKDGDEQITYGDSGGASRFFYCAKASRKERGEGNNHPTVKPLALMRWLVRLITPPGGRILDPFVGSGTTALAAKEEGFRCIGIDISEEYLESARQRCGLEKNERD